MSNRNFNKQTTNARQGFASGSMVKAISEAYKPKGVFLKKNKKSTSKELKAMEGFRKVSPKPLDNIRSKGDKMKESLTDKMRKIERPRPKKPSESPERIKRQADYMKKHGKNEPRRKTLSVKNTYKKEVEGLKK